MIDKLQFQSSFPILVVEEVDVSKVIQQLEQDF